MKIMSKTWLVAAVAVFFFAACNKVADLPVYNSGKTPALTASATTIAPAAADSLTEVVKFSWTDPEFASGSAGSKYILQIDSAGRNFSKAVSRELSNELSTSFLAKDLNAILLGFGFAFNTPYSIEARLIASYANNNNRLISNTVAMTATPYKIPPKIAVPAALYIVGNINGWDNNNPGPNKEYQFSKIDETTFAGIFYLDGGAYKLLQDLGNWSTQYHMLDGGTAASGQFEQKDADPAFPTPAVPGWYRITVNFQNATYSLEEAPERVIAPSLLFLVGNINGWNNTDTKYSFTKKPGSDFVYTLELDYNTDGFYKLLQESGNWGTQFHRTKGTEFFGEFEQKDADPAFLAPPTQGRYRITVDFAANYYWMEKI